MPKTRLFVGLDFDGTLAPIAARPELAEMTEAARAAVKRLARAPGVKVALVSGRSLKDLRRKVRIRGVLYAGNHGLEVADGAWRWRHPDLPRSLAALRRARALAKRLCAWAPGSWVEDKTLSLSVHVRAVEDPRAERRLAAGLARAFKGPGPLTLSKGKKVYEVRPALDWDKGRAMLLMMRRKAPGAAAAYVGDDRTDEDVFRRLGRGAFTVKVGPGPSRARWRAPGTWAVPALLDGLLEACS